MKCEDHKKIAAYCVSQLIGAGLLVLMIWLVPQMSFVLAEQNQAVIAVTNEQAIAAFNDRVKEYIKMRDKLEGQLPKLSSKSQPSEIETHMAALQTKIVAARSGANPGDIITPDIAGHLRSVIRQEFKGERLNKLRETVTEADTKGVPLRVNVPYPETKELVEMPPPLLLKLPTLPKQLRYQFVGRSLLIIDKEARLIVDFLPGALP